MARKNGARGLSGGAAGVGLLSATLFSVAPPSTPQTTPSAGPGLYADDPQHLWNRVHRQLFLRVGGGREYGLDEVDPLLWRETQHLLAGRSHERAVQVLDEFLARNGARPLGSLVHPGERRRGAQDSAR